MNKLVFSVGALLILISFVILGWWLGKSGGPEKTQSPISIIKPRPLDKYTIENLGKSDIPIGKIEVGDILDKQTAYTSYLFNLEFSPNLNGNETKKTTGQLNLPNSQGTFPLVIMLRGYVDQELYKTCDRTKNAAIVFSDNGYKTISPDFLDYSDSYGETGNIFEARFQTYLS